MLDDESGGDGVEQKPLLRTPATVLPEVALPLPGLLPHQRHQASRQRLGFRHSTGRCLRVLIRRERRRLG